MSEFKIPRSKPSSRLPIDAVILTPAIAKKIIFKDIGDITLCEVPFSTMSLESGVTTSATYRMRASDGSGNLVAAATQGGTVTTFEIAGYRGGVTNSELVKGTIGNISSGADIKINKTLWQAGTLVTLTNFQLVIPQGP